MSKRKDTRSEIVRFMANEREKEAIKALAEREGIGMSEYGRLMIRNAATAAGLWPSIESSRESADSAR